MRRRDLLAGGLASGLAGIAGPARSAEPAGPQPGLHDLMPGFWRVYDGSRSADLMTRARIIDAQFIAPNAPVYFAAGFGRGAMQGPVTDAAVARWLPEFDPMAEAVREVSGEIPTAWPAHDRRFRRTFPDFDPSGPTYSMISFLHFNGHGQAWNGVVCLFFGADGIVRFKPGPKPNLAVLFDHEAFHIYHGQASPSIPDQVLWSQLWKEGLATYVSEKLNPQASMADVMMDAALAQMSAADVRRAAAELATRLDSTSEADMSRYFYAGYKGDLPARSGYLVGLEICRRAGKDRTLEALARLPAQAARELVRQELKRV